MVCLLGHIGLILSLAFEALNAKQRSPAQTCAIKPHLHLQYAAPPNKQMFPWQSALFLVTSPAPRLPTHRVHDNAISAVAGGEAPAGRCRAGCCRSLQWRSAMVFGFVSFHHSKECKSHWNLPEASAAIFQTEHILGSGLAFWWTRTCPAVPVLFVLLCLHWVSPKYPAYLWGAFLFLCVCVFSTKIRRLNNSTHI